MYHQSLAEFLSIYGDVLLQAYSLIHDPDCKMQPTIESTAYACWNTNYLLNYLFLGREYSKNFDISIDIQSNTENINITSNTIYSLTIITNIEEHYLFIVTDDINGYIYSSYGGIYEFKIQILSIESINALLNSLDQLDAYLQLSSLQYDKIFTYDDGYELIELQFERLPIDSVNCVDIKNRLLALAIATMHYDFSKYYSTHKSNNYEYLIDELSQMTQDVDSFCFHIT
jgi:hypothetical protein